MFLSLQGVLFATLMYHAKVGLSFCFQIGYGHQYGVKYYCCQAESIFSVDSIVGECGTVKACGHC